MNKKGIAGVLLLMLIALFSLSAQAEWKTTDKGTIYTTTQSPGYLRGWQTIDGSKYYFKSDGIMVTGKIKINHVYYYFKKNGKLRTGLEKVGKYTYYFGSEGYRHKGWQTITVKKKARKYYFNAKNGRMVTGFATIGGKNYYFAKSGIMQYGWIRLTGKVYYADTSSGVLLKNQWFKDTYYFLSDCTMATSQRVDGKWIGSNGKYNGDTKNIGFVTKNGVTKYYDSSQQVVYGWIQISNKKYYLHSSTGALQTGWFTADGVTYYASDKGVVQTSKWIDNKYVTSSGAMATGWQTIGGKRYYFKKSGEKLTGWLSSGGKIYYLDKNGVQKKNCWVTSGKNKYHLDANGVRQTGITKIGKKYYYFSSGNGKLLYKWISKGSTRYYAHSKKGYLFRSTFFKKGSYIYYAKSDCKIATGFNVIKGKKYYFTSPNGRMLVSTKYTVNGATYYFGKKGYAITGKWKKISGKFYYFGSDGKMAVNTVINGYQVGSDGARGSKISSGWTTIDGKKYYILSSGKKATGWQTINSSKYYFTSKGVMVTGVASIGGKKYYFYPTGILATGVKMYVGTKQYTINASGVITKISSLNISGNTKGSKIAKYAVQFIGNPYVWGGTSLTGGADCSGFVQTVFANNGITLPRVADDQMKDSSGSKVASAESLLPGDLIFYGSTGYASHVAIYIGDGKVVHASNSMPYPEGGIKISEYDYNTPVAYVRYWA